VGVGATLLAFAGLALLGTLGSYRADLPGFWDYPSGTIGDGVLLPGLMAALLVQLGSKRPRDRSAERRWVAVGGFLGALVGAAVPASWYLDDETAEIWMLPTPHHYVVAGWVHLAYVTVACGALAALAAIVLRRARHGVRRFRLAPMTFVVGAGLGMLVLIGRDAIVGGSTAASAVTLAALLAAAAVFLTGMAWAGRVHVRKRAPTLVLPAAIVAVFLAGLIALIVRWPPDWPGVVGVAAASIALVCIASVLQLDGDPRRRALRWPAAAASFVILMAGLVRALDAFRHDARWPLLWVAGAVVVVVALLSALADSADARQRLLRYGGFSAYCLLMFYLAARTLAPEINAGSAGASVSAADVAFDVLVFTFIQSRFSQMSENDQTAIAAEYVAPDEKGRPVPAVSDADHPGDASDAPVILEASLLGFAVAFGLLTLLGLAADPLGLNRNTDVPGTSWLLLPAGAVTVVAILAISEAALDRWETPSVKIADLDRLELPRSYWVTPLLATATWLTVLVLLTDGPVHLPGLAAATAVLMFGLYANSLAHNTMVLQEIKMVLGHVLLCVAVGATLGYGVFWFVGSGMWEGGSPLPAVWVGLTTFVFFIGQAAVFCVAGRALAAGLPVVEDTTQKFLSRKAVSDYVGFDAVVFGIVFVIGVTIPLYAVTRDQALHASSLSVVASMVFLPGLIGGIVWGLGNWTRAEKTARSAPEGSVPWVLLVRAWGDWTKAEDADRDRLDRLSQHFRFQRFGVVALTALGVSYLAYDLIG
jgi:hypothetical protein